MTAQVSNPGLGSKVPQRVLFGGHNDGVFVNVDNNRAEIAINENVDWSRLFNTINTLSQNPSVHTIGIHDEDRNPESFIEITPCNNHHSFMIDSNALEDTVLINTTIFLIQDLLKQHHDVFLSSGSPQEVECIYDNLCDFDPTVTKTQILNEGLENDTHPPYYKIGKCE